MTIQDNLEALLGKEHIRYNPAQQIQLARVGARDSLGASRADQYAQLVASRMGGAAWEMEGTRRRF